MRPWLFILIVILITACSVKKDEQIIPARTNVEKPLFVAIYKLFPAYRDSSIWTKETLEVLGQHGAFLDSLGKQGILVSAGRTYYSTKSDSLFGVAVFTCDSKKRLIEILHTDPSYEAQVQNHEVHSFTMGIRHLDNLNSPDK